MFGAAIGNLDDHLRNHGYLRKDGAWRLSPAFDMNPEPYDTADTDTHQMSLFGDTAIDTGKLLSDDGLSLFGVSPRYAEQWVVTLRSALSQALPRASMRRLDAHSVNMMASRFDRAIESLSHVN
ncbi:HipA domain-containing protein [Bifidobacterium amazonense]|uniref:HipA domain-containing protein n=1 Tax=Bifidobacterium amazonense TaxID=2809027 RepID=A0ABS9VXC7_9BIFI|nr:HipA domain-containing protein [Bifidobacterium amazonense]